MTESLPEIVELARSGDDRAWASLVQRFHEFAVISAVGSGADRAEAQDVAQDAFLLAVRRIDRLQDAHAFPGWFAALVRTACARRTRRTPPVPVPTEALEEVPASDPGPTEEAITRERQAVARAAVEALPEPERMVVALHYLTGLSYAEVAQFAQISESAARKRAFAARNRMKELMPMMSHLKTETRARGRVRDEVQLFAAIRHRRHTAVARLLAERPALVEATEEWSWAEAVDLGLRNAEAGTPLIRAVDAGDLTTVELLLAAGAAVDGRCRCAGAETPLWTAVSLGDRPIVERLLAAGADPNATAFAGATPLHAAARHHPELIDVLVGAGADLGRTDVRGRAAADWLSRRRENPGRGSDTTAASGIRALDLFAPIRRGGVQYWPPAVEQGQTVLLYELIDVLAPAAAWWIGFSYGPYDTRSLQNACRQWGVPAHLRLAPEDLSDEDRRAAFSDALTEIARDPDEKLVVCLTRPGFRHDITAALPGLAADQLILTTIVLEPQTTEPARASGSLPEGYTSQVALDPTRARQHIYPAIDPTTTRTSQWPSAQHAHAAQRARELLADYQLLDPDLTLPDPGLLPDPKLAHRGQRLLRYLRQPFHVYEAFSSIPGQSTPIAETLNEVGRITTGVPAKGRRVPDPRRPQTRNDPTN